MSAIINKSANQIRHSKEDKTKKQRNKRHITQRYIRFAYNKIRHQASEVLSRAKGKSGVLDRVRIWPSVKKFSHAARDMYIISNNSHIANFKYLGNFSHHNFNKQIRGGEIPYSKINKAKRVKKNQIKDNKNTHVVPPPSGEPGSTAPLGEAGTERGTQGILVEKIKTHRNKNNRRSEERRKAISERMKEKRIDNSRQHKDKTNIKDKSPMDPNWMDGDARPPSNRTVAQEASNIHGNKNAKNKSVHIIKQVKLNETQTSQLKKHFTALKENRNIREREVNKKTNDEQTEKEEIEENSLEHIDNTTKNSKDKHKERKEQEKDITEAIKWSQWGK